MALEIENVKRVFKHGKEELADPGTDLDPKGVRDWYANAYPELTTAGVDGPEMEERDGERVAVYTFQKSVGRHA